MNDSGDEHEPILLPSLPGRAGIQATFTYSRPGQAKHKAVALEQPVSLLPADSQPEHPLSAHFPLKQQGTAALSSEAPSSRSQDGVSHASSSPHHSSASPTPRHALSRFHPSHTGASPASQAEWQLPAAEQPAPSPARRVRARTARDDADYEEPASSDPDAADSPDEMARYAPTRQRGRNAKLAKATASPDKRGSANKQRTSQYNGVGRAHRKQEWQARIQVDGKVTHLGYYTSEVEAARVHDKVALSLDNHAILNFDVAQYSAKEIAALRACKTRPELQRALGVKPMDKSSRFRGVSKKKNKWEAKLMRARKWAFRELFDSEEEAARAYDKAVWRLRPEMALAYVNFPENAPNESLREAAYKRKNQATPSRASYREEDATDSDEWGISDDEEPEDSHGAQGKGGSHPGSATPGQPSPASRPQADSARQSRSRSAAQADPDFRPSRSSARLSRRLEFETQPEAVPAGQHRVTPSPQQHAAWQSRTVQLVAGCPAPDYDSDDLLPQAQDPGYAQAELPRGWPQTGPAQAWQQQHQRQQQQERAGSLGPMPAEMPSFCEPAGFEEVEAAHDQAWADHARQQQAVRQHHHLGPELAGCAEPSISPGGAEAGLQQAAQWALHGTAMPQFPSVKEEEQELAEAAMLRGWGATGQLRWPAFPADCRRPRSQLQKLPSIPKVELLQEGPGLQHLPSLDKAVLQHVTSLDRSGLQHVASFDGPGLMAWSADAQGGGLPNIPSLPALRMGAPEGAAMESAEPFSPWGDYGHLLPSGRRAGTPLAGLNSPLGATFTFGEGDFQRQLAEMHSLDAATFLAGPGEPAQAPLRQPSRLGPAAVQHPSEQASSQGQAASLPSGQGM